MISFLFKVICLTGAWYDEADTTNSLHPPYNYSHVHVDVTRQEQRGGSLCIYP